MARSQTHEFNRFNAKADKLEREWRVTIQTPAGGLESLFAGLGKEIPLVQGPYDHCVYVREGGQQRFRALEGSHAGDEGTIQATPASEIVFTIPPNLPLLEKVFETVFAVHSQEEPTMHVEEIWGSRSNFLDDKDNPNRYWNRPDAETLHGEVIETPDD
jgi:hypothetical protein